MNFTFSTETALKYTLSWNKNYKKKLNTKTTKKFLIVQLNLSMFDFSFSIYLFDVC